MLDADVHVARDSLNYRVDITTKRTQRLQQTVLLRREFLEKVKFL